MTACHNTDKKPETKTEKTEPAKEASGSLKMDVTVNADWTKDDTPAIAHIKGSDKGTSKNNDNVDLHHAVTPGKDNARSSVVSLPGGDYTIEWISHLRKDANSYVVYDTGKPITVMLNATDKKSEDIKKLEDKKSEDTKESEKKTAISSNSSSKLAISSNSSSSAAAPEKPTKKLVTKKRTEQVPVTKKRTETYTENVEKTRVVPYEERVTKYKTVYVDVPSNGDVIPDGVKPEDYIYDTYGVEGFKLSWHEEAREILYEEAVTKYRTETYTEPLEKTREVEYTEYETKTIEYQVWE